MTEKWVPLVGLTGVAAAMVLYSSGVVWPVVLWLLLVAPPARYLLSLAGLALIRAYVVRNVRPSAGQLPEPGAVSDPDAAWRMWLEPRHQHLRGLSPGSS